MTALVFGLFGLIIGSFLNVVILRRKVKTLGGRSVCTHCGHQLSALDLIPVFSYLALGGRCRYCGGKISAQYPIVEALTALSFAALGAAPVPLLLQILALPIAALFIVIGFYDGRHTIIPDEWVWPLAGLAFLFGVLYSGDPLSAVLSALGAAAPFAFLWFVSHGRWMGLGDAKLALAIGALLGPWDTYLALTAAFVLGALFFVPQLAVAAVEKRRGTSAASYTMSSEVPFGPFLILACVFLWLLALYGSDPAAFLFAGSL